MIGRLIGGILSLVIYFCVATVLAEVILLVFAAKSWGLDRTKLIRVLAAAQGVELAPKVVAAPGKSPGESGEQASYEQLLEARALKARNLELREQALHNGLDQLGVEQAKLAATQADFQRSRDQFQADVDALAKKQKELQEGGYEEVRRSLIAAKPKQAKDLIVQMMEKNEINDVVALLTPVPEKQRAKIFAEFKGEEVRKVDEILRLIRRGEPINSMVPKIPRASGVENPVAAQGNP